MNAIKSIFTNFSDEKNQDKEMIKNNENKIGKEKKVKNCDYDVVIDIKSIRNLNKAGWNIIYSGNKEKLKETIKSSYKIIISVLGNSNRGKTYLLNKLSKVNLDSGYQIQTKGLSMKFHNELIYLDTAGTNTPLLLEDKKRPTEAEIQDIHLCQIITNYMIQTFVIDSADILLCVIGMLNSAEQIFLEKIKKLCENKRNLIVIHNLVKCFNNADIEKYKTETLLKMIGTELIPKKIPYFKEGYKGFDKYFLEKGNRHIKHFIFANDEKKSEEIDYYNETTLNYIRTCIKMERKKQKDLIKQLIDHIKNISSFVLQNEISPKIEGDLIKCDSQEIVPKDIKADELDNINFIGKEYEPHHRYYRKGHYFIIEIQLCSNKYEVKCNKALDIDSEETKFEIIGKRELDDKNDSIFTFANKRENFKKFKIMFKIKLSDFGINHIDQEPKKIMKYGILFIIYKSL